MNHHSDPPASQTPSSNTQNDTDTVDTASMSGDSIPPGSPYVNTQNARTVVLPIKLRRDPDNPNKCYCPFCELGFHRTAVRRHMRKLQEKPPKNKNNAKKTSPQC